MANTLRFKRGLASGLPTGLAGEPLFTTDTFDLYIGNGTGNTRFQKYIASGTTSQILRGDGSLLTMPIVLTSPSNGQVLKYDGTNWVNSADAGVTGSGANGQVTFWNSASTITGSNNLFWDNSTGRLGINRPSPSYILDIGSSGLTIASVRGGSSTNQSAAFYVTKSDSSGTLTAYGDEAAITGGTPNLAAMLFTAASIPLKFYLNGALRMTLNESGRLLLGSATDNGLRFQVTGDGYFSGSVGIGTSTLDYKLNVAGANLSTIGMIDTAEATDQKRWVFQYGTTVGAGTFRLRAINDANSNGQNAYIITRSGIAVQTHQWLTANTERMRLDASGNLGLGVTPTRLFHIYKSAAATEAYIQADAAQQAALYFKTPSTAIYVPTSSSTELRFYVNSLDRMTIDSSGNLGFGVTPSAWRSTERALQIGSYTSVSDVLGYSSIGNNFFANASNQFIYLNTAATSVYSQNAGSHIWQSAASGTAGTSFSFTTRMTLFQTGNLTIGSTTTDAGFRLDVNGTMRVSGASTFNGAATLSINQNAATAFTISNTTSGTASLSSLSVESNASAGVFRVGKYSTTTTPYKTLNSSDGYLYNFTAGDISILNDFASGSIKLAAGASSTAHFTIASTGAATFSSTAQAAGFITSGGTGYAVINSAATTVTALRPTGGGSSIMSTNSNGLHIAVGTQAAGDLILASNNTERIRLSQNGFFSQLNATNPSASITDSYIQYSADVTAGNAAPHFRTENGAVIKLYQETTAVGNAIIGTGGGNAVLDDTTFDGYTLRQLVRALRNQGILQ